MVAPKAGRVTIPGSAHRDDFRSTGAVMSDEKMREYIHEAHQDPIEREQSFIQSKAYSNRVEWEQERERSKVGRIAEKILDFCTQLPDRLRDMFGHSTPPTEDYENYESPYPSPQRVNTSMLGRKKRQSTGKSRDTRKSRKSKDGGSSRSASPTEATEKRKYESREQVEMVVYEEERKSLKNRGSEEIEYH